MRGQKEMLRGKMEKISTKGWIQTARPKFLIIQLHQNLTIYVTWESRPPAPTERCGVTPPLHVARELYVGCSPDQDAKRGSLLGPNLFIAPSSLDYQLNVTGRDFCHCQQLSHHLSRPRPVSSTIPSASQCVLKGQIASPLLILFQSNLKSYSHLFCRAHFYYLCLTPLSSGWVLKR